MENNTLHIFLADDDEDDRLLFTEALKELSLSVEVTSFTNGVDLMASLLDPKRSLPDVVYLDLNMPLMDGEECLADIRNEPQLSEVPVIIYSTFLDLSKAALLQTEGADHYLQKPKLFNDLKSCLQKSINSIEKSKLHNAAQAEFLIKP